MIVAYLLFILLLVFLLAQRGSTVPTPVPDATLAPVPDVPTHTPDPMDADLVKATGIFVFGSNRAGQHAGGAARFAADQLGAEWGVGEGRTGFCYALPTKGHQFTDLTIEEIRAHVDRFIDHASEHRNQTFWVTKVGCGIAGWKVSDIAPLFARAADLRNVKMPIEFERAHTDRAGPQDRQREVGRN